MLKLKHLILHGVMTNLSLFWVYLLLTEVVKNVRAAAAEVKRFGISWWFLLCESNHNTLEYIYFIALRIFS